MMSGDARTRERGVLRWYGEPVFTGERWMEDGLWHLTAEEANVMVAAESMELAADKLLHAVIDLLYFLAEIPSDEITAGELELRNLLLSHLGPAFLKHRRRERWRRIGARVRCAAAARLPGRRSDRATSWDQPDRGPSTPSGSVAVSSA